MTPLHEPGPEDQLVSYLLGLLPDEEAERLDELNIADEEFAWRLRVVEDDLIDAYVTGALTGDTLERFESFYLASEHRRRKVKFARSFRRVVDRGIGTAGAGAGRNHIRPPGSERNRISSAGFPANQSMPPRQGWVWRLAAAAALVLLAGGALYEDVRLRGALNEARGSQHRIVQSSARSRTAAERSACRQRQRPQRTGEGSSPADRQWIGVRAGAVSRTWGGARHVRSRPLRSSCCRKRAAPVRSRRSPSRRVSIAWRSSCDSSRAISAATRWR